MSMARALAVLGASMSGYGAGQDQARQRQRQDEDDAFRREQRDRQRTDWQRSDEEYAQKRADDAAARGAMAPTEVKPELTPDQAGPQGYMAGGKTFGDQAKANAAATAYNSPAAGMARAAGAVRDPMRAAQLQTQANAAQLGQIQLDEAQQAQIAAAWKRKAGAQIVGSGSWDVATKFLTESKADGLDGSSQWTYRESADGTKVDVFPTKDGKQLNKGFTVDNNDEGRLQLFNILDTSTPAIAKLADLRAERQAKTAAEDKKADNERADRQLTATGAHQAAVLAETKRHNQASEGIARSAAQARMANAAGAGAAPVWDDKADQFLRENYTLKDPNGGQSVDGNGMQFSKMIALGQSRLNGGDTTRALGFAFQKDNELRAEATDKKKGYQPQVHAQLREQYLDRVLGRSKPDAAATKTAPPPPHAAAGVPAPRSGMAAAAAPPPAPPFVPNDAMERAVLAQHTEMGAGSRMQYTPEVAAYVRAKRQAQQAQQEAETATAQAAELARAQALTRQQMGR